MVHDDEKYVWDPLRPIIPFPSGWTVPCIRPLTAEAGDGMIPGLSGLSASAPEAWSSESRVCPHPRDRQPQGECNQSNTPTGGLSPPQSRVLEFRNPSPRVCAQPRSSSDPSPNPNYGVCPQSASQHLNKGSVPNCR